MSEEEEDEEFVFDPTELFEREDYREDFSVQVLSPTVVHTLQLQYMILQL